MKALPLLLACLPLLTACHVEVDSKTGEVKKVNISLSKDKVTVTDTAPVAKESRKVAAIKAIESYGPIDIDVTIGDVPAMELEGSAKVLSYIKTVVEGDTLKVRMEPDENLTIVVPLKVKLVTPALRSISSFGSGDISVRELKGGELDVTSKGSSDLTLAGRVDKLVASLQGSGDLNGEALESGSAELSIVGSGDMKLSKVNAQTLYLDIKGSGSIEVHGQTKQVKANVFGSGDATLTGLTSQQADLAVFGSGDITATVAEQVKASTRGSGNIAIYGNPSKREVSGDGIEFL
ncbi:head GIN domain-containing protein [Chitinimonas lacunae]|uniref:Head GIN domain-containing protein n=1 Tax=Chitinimonas lacunae TaxID=1963018 RepID=A0ABV8MLB6_9NEIS